MSNKSFIDSEARIGRPIKAPESELKLPVNPFSRSLSKLSSDKVLHIEIRPNSYLVINTAGAIGDKIKINKTNSIRFAEWILDVYSRRKLNVRNGTATKETKMARQSKGSK